MKIKIIIISSLLFCVSSCFAAINVKKPTSTIEIGSGASLVAEGQITNYQGALIKDTGGSIEGNDIGFSSGTFIDGISSLRLTGSLNAGTIAQIVLSGAQTFKGKRGDILQSLMVHGKNNRIEGFVACRNEIALQDNATTVTFAASGRMLCNIALNGGTAFLEEDLHFVDDMFFTGSGVIKLNHRKLRLGSKEMTINAPLYFDQAQDIELSANTHLASTWTFSGQGILEGNNKILYLEDGGNIVVNSNSSLLFRGVTILGITGTNIRCIDNLSTLSFQDVNWVQDGNYSFTVGCFDIISKLKITGAHTFAYQTTQQSRILSDAKMIFDAGVTFSYDPASSSRNLISLVNEHSKLRLDGATLYSTATGLQLTKGVLQITGDSYFKSDALIEEEGIIFGDGISAENDLQVEVLPGAKMKITSGFVVYQDLL